MKPARLLAPRSVAVVGASTRPGSYGNQAVANLLSARFPGPVFGVHPTATQVHGVPCVPRISDLPLAPDALVIATPAAGVPALVAEAGAYGCGGAVVLAAGFAEIAGGRDLQDELTRQAHLHDLPICGPNGNGIVSVVNRAPLWGDAYTARRPGPVALISQSGNVAVNALLSTRALGLHTVISCGNQAVLDASDYLSALADLDGVRSIALYLEDEGDGHRLATALAHCADHGIRTAVLKAGTSPLGASAAAAHTGSITGDSRLLRALIQEAGGTWAQNPHELLELAKTLATPRRPLTTTTTDTRTPNGPMSVMRNADPTTAEDGGTPMEGSSGSSIAKSGGTPVTGGSRTSITKDDGTPIAEEGGTSIAGGERAGVAARERGKGWVGGRGTGSARGVLVVTCSGGDAATAADEAERLGVWLPGLGVETVEALRGVLPATATAGNPLDYTAVIFGETERTADLITVGARDDAIGPVLVYYDRPAQMTEDAAESWDGALDGVILAASRLTQPIIVASTLPELMPEETAERLAAHGIVPVAGLTEGILCAGALTTPPPDPARLRAIAAATRPQRRTPDELRMQTTPGPNAKERPDTQRTRRSGTEQMQQTRRSVTEETQRTRRSGTEQMQRTPQSGILEQMQPTCGSETKQMQRTRASGTEQMQRMRGSGAEVVSPSGWMAEHEAKGLLRAWGLPVPRGRVAVSADDAVGIATELNRPVAMKASSPFIQHKSDISALELGVTRDNVRDVYRRLTELGSVLVEEMADPGVEVMIAVRRDGLVPVVVVALGGLWVEIFDDAVLIPLPADPQRLEQEIHRLKAAPLLTGTRGTPPSDVPALAALASQLGTLALTENLDLIELNPVFVHPTGVTIADALIRRRT
ncbi:hypothetical protein Aph01nite_23850 [Acrocarpospora phusangensis]|uniref:ATP-grasp domain-containing protein n=1 Tax=Acrocarpospora phusangensis TaxID=1070424 RepID=A0A919QB22_9ACTN|nr:acetate--CoA ligase family protein [Acrocarpospora phusangensis]GIH24075.1 hypothetical protein Aph01nite_23850 [Acrocarpospora phusangensis]